jgi:alpha-amylase/alpha-mannosidase (GH57 family)
VSPPVLVVHGHFYQPPRENPWTEAVPVEASAAPYHDWNARITAESYRPNGWARVVDERDRVVAIVNDYEHLSFNVGPTLASWLAEHEPDVVERMFEGDRAGGGALAQAYNHMILPLANERDVRTQVRWGLTDFRHRFGRNAEGMWLPETAVDDAVLRILAEEGVLFTLLAPGQALRVRPVDGDGTWTEAAGGAVDTRQTYRWRDPDDPEVGVDLIFYNGSLSHEIAFGASGLRADDLVRRVGESAGPTGGLVCIATDGETFGHHHRFAERILAYALPIAAPRAGVAVTTAADHLRANRPAWEAQIVRSAWSCAHGVGRWETDCGCSTGGFAGADQRWRAPLRAALDLVRDAGIEVFEHRGAEMLADPWAARDAYGEVVVGARTVDDFAAEHVKGEGADRRLLVDALTLLEQQRHALLMYTSCAWFFWDLAGLETVQCLRYAARGLDLLAELGEEPPVAAFLDVLATAQSNVPEEGDGRDIWHRHVLPARVDPDRAVAHVALRDVLGQPDRSLVGPFHVSLDAHARARRGPLLATAGIVTLEHRRTRRVGRHAYAAVHIGGLEITVCCRPADDERDLDDLRAVEVALDTGTPVAELARIVVARFGPATFGFEAALPGEAEELLATAAADIDENLARAVERAVAGEGITAADGTEAALNLLRLAQHVGVGVDLERAQELVYDALLAHPDRAHLRLLGRRLHLAVDHLGTPH